MICCFFPARPFSCIPGAAAPVPGEPGTSEALGPGELVHEEAHLRLS